MDDRYGPKWSAGGWYLVIVTDLNGRPLPSEKRDGGEG